MSNMSYCRMENTSHDLSDCVDALNNPCEKNALSRSESNALVDLIGYAAQLLEAVGVDVQFSDLPNLDDLKENNPEFFDAHYESDDDE